MPKRLVSLGSESVAVGYVRVSTDEQSLGPAAQRAALERWASSSGVRLVAVFEDVGVSGGAALDARPGLLEALDALAEHGAGALVVAKRDRLARDPMVAAMIEAAAKRSGAAVLSAAGEGNGDDPTAILMRRIVDAFAEYERLLIRSRTRAALGVKRSRGERVGEIPYGKRLAADGTHLEEHPAESRVLVLVRALRAEGLSLRAIAERLNAEGVAARGARWHTTTVVRLLEREAA